MINKPFREIYVVLAFAFYKEQILLLERKDSKFELDHKWELPGGKINQGESVEQALIREFFEETGARLEDISFLGVHPYDWHFSDEIVRVQLHCYKANCDTDQIIIEDRSAYQYQFLTPNEAVRLALLPVNKELIERYCLKNK